MLNNVSFDYIDGKNEAPKFYMNQTGKCVQMVPLLGRKNAVSIRNLNARNSTKRNARTEYRFHRRQGMCRCSQSPIDLPAEPSQ